VWQAERDGQGWLYGLFSKCGTVEFGLESDMPILARLKGWARHIRRDVHALYLASRDPRVPWYAKFAAVCIAVYALSPIDLIPDLIPVLGYLDEVILLPIAILLVVKLIPPPIMAEHRAAAEAAEAQPTSRIGAAFIIGLWIAAALLLLWLFWPEPAVGTVWPARV
jgi:uncharacterized membrane protein YkvA (DUF1232 family)